ncbi:MAG TPA: DUF962 domain-containing protein [Candidatus Acidoferrum sp.]|nr:DUF962 domain-containing protein [Candidatus Acidoferrum sp.]
MADLAHYMSQYDHEHHSGWNKLLHAIGIPLIFAGIVLLVLRHWGWGAGSFVGGWVLLLLGHRIEGNNPAFFQGPIYLLVGPIWVAKEAWTFLFHGSAKEEAKKEGQTAS